MTWRTVWLAARGWLARLAANPLAVLLALGAAFVAATRLRAGQAIRRARRRAEGAADAAAAAERATAAERRRREEAEADAKLEAERRRVDDLSDDQLLDDARRRVERERSARRGVFNPPGAGDRRGDG